MNADHPEQRPPMPDRIGDYQVLAYLGAGGMGRVYKARAPDGRLVAIKLVHPELAAVPEFRERFANEVRNAARVPRYWTAEVLGWSLDGDQLSMVTEFINGRTLHAAVTTDGPWSGAALEQLGINTAAALDAIHHAGVAHRDFKPSNVLLTEAGPRVIDFGIARAFDTTAAMLTATGQVVGTPGFIAPEVYAGQSATPAADVFAWGGVMAFAATGRFPFGTGRWEAVAYRVMHNNPNLDGLDGRLLEVVTDALATDPAARPSPKDLQERLAGEPAPTPPPPHAPATRPAAAGDGRSRPSQAALSTAPARSEAPRKPQPAVPQQHLRRPGVLGAVGLLATAVVVAAAVMVARMVAPESEFSIQIGEQVSHDEPGRGAGVLTAAAPQDTYVFDGDRDQMVFLDEVACESETGQPFFSARWTLTAPGGQALRSGDLCHGSSSLPLLERALPAGGDYRLTVAATTSVRGTYAFRLTEPPKVSVGTQAVQFSDGEADGAASIGTAAEADVYQFQADANQILFFDVRSCADGLDAELKVTGPSGDVKLLGGRKVCDSGAVDPGWTEPLQAGPHSLVVQGRGGGTGPYELSVRATIDETFQILPGQTITLDTPAGAGRIRAPGDADWYQFSAQRGDRVTFDIGPCTTGGTGFLMDLRGPDSTDVEDVIVESSVACANGEHASVDATLPADGTYEVSVHGGGGDTVGSYTAATLTVE